MKNKNTEKILRNLAVAGLGAGVGITAVIASFMRHFALSWNFPLYS
ncbi:MAG: hypothetical protein ACI4EO_06215 [Blautia sp.]